MRLLISFVSILLVLSLIPEICHSEEGWYRLLDYGNKTAFIDSVKAAIDDYDIPFDSENHRSKFLNHIQHVYSLRDNQNWTGITNFISDTMITDTSWITNSKKRASVKNILNLTSDIYSDNLEAVVLESDLDSVGKYLRFSLNIGLLVIDFDYEHEHLGAWTKHESDCTTENHDSCDVKTK